MTPDTAWADLESLRAWNPVTLDSQLLERAHTIFASHSLSWWDSLIVAAAEASGPDTLYSKDLQNGAVYGEVTIVNPFTDL